MTDTSLPPLSSSEEWRQTIRSGVVDFATNGKTGDPDFMPLFQRAGIKDSPDMQQDIIRLAVEYVDMALIRQRQLCHEQKLALQLSPLRRKHARKELLTAGEQCVYDNASLESMQTRAMIRRVQKEVIIWNTHAMEVLNQYPEELASYCRTRIDPSDSVPAVIMLGSIARLVGSVKNILQGKPPVSNIDVEVFIPPETTLEKVPAYYAAMNQHYPSEAELSTATDVVNDHFRQLSQKYRRDKHKPLEI